MAQGVDTLSAGAGAGRFWAGWDGALDVNETTLQTLQTRVGALAAGNRRLWAVGGGDFSSHKVAELRAASEALSGSIVVDGCRVPSTPKELKRQPGYIYGCWNGCSFRSGASLLLVLWVVVGDPG
ncbi:hypothetical protein DOTSEDRAFT_38020 [Dothistroma septosporum NZE10]|uniref:Uncharacterized protein n=1 Tax=Dothistroma septosporum (strain NZE10 / CBS 128990) TaxID=675120 RepID=N1PFB8_DOTSN|nr:hypothetical protein DOTSEDRAFT_38020 [Dothistroma septosporum NZE10]